MIDFPGAKRMAREVTVEDGHSLDDLEEIWRTTFRARVGAEPSDGQRAAAREVLEERLRNDAPPPLPPSASSSSWARLPVEEIGVPGWSLDDDG